MEGVESIAPLLSRVLNSGCLGLGPVGGWVLINFGMDNIYNGDFEDTKASPIGGLRNMSCGDAVIK